MLPFRLGNCSIKYLLARVSVTRHLDIFAQQWILRTYEHLSPFYAYKLA